jgi:hypothetical protein
VLAFPPVVIRPVKPSRTTSKQEGSSNAVKIRLGIDIACRATHQASCADEAGRLLWSGHRFRTDAGELEALWAKLPAPAAAASAAS